MLGPEEREALFWIGRNYCCGKGHIIDAGAFLGTSAFSLASGLAHSARDVSQSRIFSYDLFRADEEYVAAYIAQKFHDFRQGESFFEIYQSQIEKYAHLIVPIQGDFSKIAWLKLPIEVLFVDLDKSSSLHKTFLLEYYPYIIPNHGILAHQDWYLSRHPWLHFGMEYLEPYFTIIDPLVKWCTRLFKLERSIPDAELELLASGGLGYDREISLLNRLIEKERGNMRSMMRLSKVIHMLSHGEWDHAHDELRAVSSEIDNSDDSLRSEFNYVQSRFK